MTDPRELADDPAPYPVGVTRAGARLFFRMHRQRGDPAPGAEMPPQGLGRKRHHRRRARASGTRPFRPVTGLNVLFQSGGWTEGQCGVRPFTGLLIALT